MIVQKIIGLVVISALLAAVANTIHPRRIPWVQAWRYHVEAQAREAGIKTIPLSVAIDLFKNQQARFIDARTTDEFAAGHIPGAISIPVETMDEAFMQLFEQFDFERRFIVYCKNRDCDDALLVAKELQAMGTTNLMLYVDGFKVWKTHDGEIEVAE